MSKVILAGVLTNYILEKPKKETRMIIGKAISTNMIFRSLT